MIHHLPPDATRTARFAARRAELCAEMTARMVQSDPYPGTLARALHLPQAPLDCREMIPDATLRRWAAGEPEAIVGEISAELQQELAMLLPDLCGELLGRRALAEAEGRP